jgi:RHS repeat-associated protein
MHRNISVLPFIVFSVVLQVVYPTVFGQSPVTPPAAYSSNVKKNYVRSWDATAPITNPADMNTGVFKDVKQSTQYFDGLGRPLQIVVKKGSLVTDPGSPASSTNAVDMVSASVYDEFGREQHTYLPFAANTAGGNSSINDGNFKLNPFQQQAAFAGLQYPGEVFFYSKTNFEASPMNRISNTYAPGDSWVGSEANVSEAARRNTATEYSLNEASDSVRIWTVGGGTLSTSASYAATQLHKIISMDEHKNRTVEYKDKEEKLILKKVQLNSSPATGHYGWLCTYYIYDDFDLLRGVLQPNAVEELLGNGWSVTSDILNELTFRYEYDGQNRMVIKKVPGSGEVRMVYDKWDRLVLTQDANLRLNNKWLFTKYDQLNRPIMKGFYTNTTYTTQSAMQGYVDGLGLARSESYQTASFPLYSLTLSFPSVSFSDVLTVTYYDDYSWAGWYGSYGTKDNSWDGEFATPNNSTWPYPQPLTQSSQTKGLVTGVWDKTGSGILIANYYDDNARIIQTKTYNYTTGVDILTFQYSFSGQVLHTILRHQKEGSNSQTHLVQTKLSYDDGGRLISADKKLSSAIGSATFAEDWHTTVAIEYDALGQLKKKTFAPNYGSGGLDTLANTYNIQGWLTSINKGYVTGTSTAWFGMELGYDKDGYASFTNKHFDGNISGIIWRSRGDGEKRMYDFSYDPISRLLAASFTQQSGNSWNKDAGIDFSMALGDGADPLTAYDANGNIKKMWQKGWKLGGSVTIDSLVYKNNNYSNKLRFVRDVTNDPTTSLGDFKETSQNNADNFTSNTADYSYDENGNLLSDNNKGISSIVYNHLNLPTTITVSGKGSIEYVYDNTGAKVKRIVHETGKADKITLYVAGFVYENDTLQLLQHEEGRIRLSKNTSNVNVGYIFDYFEKDHLGNIRVVLTERQDTSAYPEASMEDANLARDTTYYSKVSETRVDRTTVSGYPSNDTYTSPNDYVAKVSGSGQKLGPGIVLKVMAGDKFNLRVSSWYKANGASPGTPVSPLNDLLAALIAGVSGGGKFGVTELQNSTSLSSNVTSFLDSQSYTAGRPKAYINWILFNEQMVYQSSSSGFAQVPDESVYNNSGTPNVYLHQHNNLLVNKSGYLYVYVSNETPNIDVFFDNLQVTHIKGALLEETHYYPFGLIMEGISSKAHINLVNNYKYNGGSEFASRDFTDGSGLQMYETQFRSYDPQVGRFHQLDPLSEITKSLSLYLYASNNPVLRNDPFGLIDTVINGKRMQRDKDLPTHTISVKKGQKGQSIIKDGLKSLPYAELVDIKIERNLNQLKRIEALQSVTRAGHPASRGLDGAWLKKFLGTAALKVAQKTFAVIEMVNIGMTNKDRPLTVPFIGAATGLIVDDMVASSDELTIEVAVQQGYLPLARVMNSSVGRRSGLVGVYVTTETMESILASGGLDLRVHKVGASNGNYPDNPVDKTGKKYDFFVLYPAGSQNTITNFGVMPIR